MLVATTRKPTEYSGGLWGDRIPHAVDHADRRRATLALIPISHQIFWGTMAFAMMGGIVIGAVLTLLFLRALYVAWFRIPAPEAAKSK